MIKGQMVETVDIVGGKLMHAPEIFIKNIVNNVLTNLLSKLEEGESREFYFE